jgi:RHS repeat-associated protein
MNLNGIEYYYVKNLQGDIMGLKDSTGTQVVSYTYDTWGKLETLVDVSGKNVGKINSYRYRAYRYDTETGLYYSKSRYYNPEWGRFINADAIVGQTGELLTVLKCITRSI